MATYVLTSLVNASLSMCVSMLYIYKQYYKLTSHSTGRLPPLPQWHSYIGWAHRVQVVERPRVRRSSITGSEVYAYSEVDLTTSHDEVKKGINCPLLQYK